MNHLKLRALLSLCAALALCWLAPGCGDDAPAETSTLGERSTAVPGPGERNACSGQADCSNDQICREERCLTLCPGGEEACGADEFCDSSGLCRPLVCERDSDCTLRHETCQEGVCDIDPALDCRPNGRSCDGDDLVICSSAGEVFERRECAPEGVCVESAGEASCVTQVCTPGERSCVAVDVVGVCNEAGDAVEMEPCPAQSFCAAGVCEAQVCDPLAAGVCEGSEIVVCAPNGDREFTVVDCDPLPCEDGACQGSLSDGCTVGSSFRCYDGEEPADERGLCNYGTRTCGEDRRFGPCEGWTTPAENPCPEEAITCPTAERVTLLAGSAGEALREALGGAGFDVRDSGLLTVDAFDDADVIIVRAAFATTDNRRMLDWVTQEGGVLIVHGTETTGNTDECALVNSTIGPLGLRFDCTRSASGAVASLGTHPLTEGVSPQDLPVGPGPVPVALDPARTTVLAEGAGGIYALAAERDCGRVLLLSSLDALRDQPGEGPARFRANLVDWLRR